MALVYFHPVKSIVLTVSTTLKCEFTTHCYELRRKQSAEFCVNLLNFCVTRFCAIIRILMHDIESTANYYYDLTIILGFI